MTFVSGRQARADDDVREIYETELRGIVQAVAAGIGSGADADRRADAIALLTLLAGGVSIARGVKDPAMSEEIANAVRRAADTLAIANVKAARRGE